MAAELADKLGVQELQLLLAARKARKIDIKRDGAIVHGGPPPLDLFSPAGPVGLITRTFYEAELLLSHSEFEFSNSKTSPFYELEGAVLPVSTINAR